MRGLGGHQGQLGAVLVEKVNEDRIRAGHVVERLDEFIKGRFQIKRGIGDLDDPAQNCELLGGADIELLVDCFGHTERYCNIKIIAAKK